MAFRHDVAGGNGALIVPALHSPNFETGVQGWSIDRDGSVEFNDGTFRGTISGGTLVIEQGSGATFEKFEIDGSTGVTTWSKYESPTVVIRQILANGTDLIYSDPGNGGSQGDLLISVASIGGTALDGTTYGHGLFFWQPGLGACGIASVGGIPVLDMSAPDRTHGSSDAEVFTQAVNAGAANEYVLSVFTSGKENNLDDAALQLFSEAADGSTPAQAVFEFGGQVAVFIAADSGVVACQPGTANTAETWHLLSLVNSWGLSSDHLGHYRLMPDGTVWVMAVIVGGTSTTIATLPAGYRPSLRVMYAPCVGTGALTTGLFVSVDTNGVLQLNTISSVGDVVINFRFPVNGP